MTPQTRLSEVEKKMMEAVDRRVGEMLGQVVERQARTDGKIEEILQAISALNVRNHKEPPKVEGVEGDNAVINPPGGFQDELGRSTRYEFPKFDGDGFEGWVMRAEFFFEVAKVADRERVRVVAVHLEGKALQWHRGFMNLQGPAASYDWNTYITALGARFGVQAYDDPLAELRNLRQTGTLQAYMDAFDEICPRTGIREDQALSLFLSGLVAELEMPVRMFKPKGLAEAYSLAKLQDITVRALGGRAKGAVSAGGNSNNQYSNSKSLAVTATSFKPSGGSASGFNKDAPRFGNTRLGPKLSNQEIDEKRAKGQCFWCTEKYTPTHNCAKRKAFSVHMIEETGGEVAGDGGKQIVTEEEVNEDALQLSLHALCGRNGPQIMRIKGMCQRRQLRVLIDTGSTHNFLNERLVGRLKCKLTPVPPRHVEVANGQLLQCTQRCENFTWDMQGVSFEAEVYLINLESYDLILGGQWLSTLGYIGWDFSDLSMVFELRGERVKLQGESWPSKQEQLHCLHILNPQEGDANIGKLNLMMPTVEGENWSCYSADTAGVWPELESLINSYSALFEEPKGLPPIREQDHRIVLKEGAEAVNIRPYKYASQQKDVIDSMVEEMLRNGVIRPSMSPFASPIVLVKKKDASWRMCIDYRGLNAITIKDKYPIPVIEELLDELGSARWFTKIDLRSGYWQVRMAPDDVFKTAFKTHAGHYEFLVMSFGLTNAPATFQSLMNTVFREYLRKFVLVFFDDILIYSASQEDHVRHLSLVLELMQGHELFAKKSKCSFGCEAVEYLGHVISKEGVATDEGKVEAVRNWPQPRTIKQVRSFLGLTGYYRRFVQGYGSVTKPLIEVIKGPTFMWTEAAQDAFDKLKLALISAPVLALPDFTKDFTVETDASGVGIGAILMQDGHPVAYISKALSPKYQALSVYEKELLAILLAVKKWYHYLQCRKFIILTDHQSLKYLLEQKLTTPTQQAWMAKLMHFDYEIRYKKGVENSAADALSRVPEVMLYALTSCVIPVELVGKIRNSWLGDSHVQSVIKSKEHSADSYPKYTWQNGDLRRHGKLVVGNDVELKAQILSLFHDSALAGHSGALATYKRLSSLLYWPKMLREAREFVRMCVTCQRFKAGNSPPVGLLQPLPLPETLFSDLTMDFIEALPTSHGKNTIFVVVDRLSKFAHFVALSRPFTAKTVADAFLNTVFKLHGLPSRIVSDRGSVFMGAFWKELFAFLGVELLYSTAYHPETDGQSEVVNRCLQCYLRCSVGEKPNSWAQWLGLAEHWYNTSYHSSIKMTPFEALYGYAPPLHVPYLPGDSKIEAVDITLRNREVMIQLLKRNLQKAADRMRKQANRHRIDRAFSIGDWVWLKLQDYRQTSIRGKHHKFEPKFFGPYQITDKVGEVAYKLNLPPSAAIHNVFHVSLLKPAPPPNGPVPDLPTISHINDDVPQAILERKMVKRRNEAATQWLIHWSGKSPADASWEFADVIKERFPWFLEDKEP